MWRARIPRPDASSQECPTGRSLVQGGSTMRFTYRLMGAVFATGGLLLLAASPASAAAPSNDVFGGAIAIGALPFNTSLDTTQATTDADDVSANTNCGAP